MHRWSQWGEEEIIHSLLSRMDISSGFFVEFGAWDGKRWSNTYALYESGWAGCYIEGEPAKVKDLQQNCPEDRVLKICSFVRPNGPQSLDNILIEHGVKTVHVLSIDIDGDDYAVWESVMKYLPVLLVIEYNPTIPFDTRYINPCGSSHGNSALSLKELSESKGYVLVAGTPTNLIFAKADLACRHGIPATTLQDIQNASSCPRFFFCYDGTLMRLPSSLREAGVDEMFVIPWSGCVVPQPVPKMLRKFRRPNSLTYVVRILYGGLRCFIRSPLQLLKTVWLAGRSHTVLFGLGEG